MLVDTRDSNKLLLLLSPLPVSCSPKALKASVRSDRAGQVYTLLSTYVCSENINIVVSEVNEAEQSYIIVNVVPLTMGVDARNATNETGPSCFRSNRKKVGDNRLRCGWKRIELHRAKD